MAAELDKAGIARAYARWAPIYDVVLSTVYSTAGGKPRSRRPSGSAAAFSKSASAPGCHCPIMRATNRLVGVDLSAPMLRKAKERVDELRLGPMSKGLP